MSISSSTSEQKDAMRPMFVRHGVLPLVMDGPVQLNVPIRYTLRKSIL